MGKIVWRNLNWKKECSYVKSVCHKSNCCSIMFVLSLASTAPHSTGKVPLLTIIYLSDSLIYLWWVFLLYCPFFTYLKFICMSSSCLVTMSLLILRDIIDAIWTIKSRRFVELINTAINMSTAGLLMDVIKDKKN